MHIARAHLSPDLGPIRTVASGKGWALDSSAGLGSSPRLRRAHQAQGYKFSGFGEWRW